MGDALWAKYSLGEMFGVKDGDAPAKRNPYATITGLPIPGLGITELLKLLRKHHPELQSVGPQSAHVLQILRRGSRQ